MSGHSEEQLIECYECGKLWLIDFAGFPKISTKLMERSLCELTKEALGNVKSPKELCARFSGLKRIWILHSK